MSLTSDQVQLALNSGGDVVSPSHDRIGRIGQIYLDDHTQDPVWLTVRNPESGAERFVPLDGATWNGSSVVVAHEADTIRGAPQIAASGSLSRADAHALADYYRVPSPSGDGVMIRSEERLQVGVSRHATERVRLRKRIVTEEVTQTVAVRREVFEIEREPLSDPTGQLAVPTSADAAGDLDLILYEERVVMQKQIVPVERIRVRTERLTGEETISVDLRREQVDASVDTLDDTSTADR